MKEYKEFLSKVDDIQLSNELDTARKTVHLAYKIGYQEIIARVEQEIEWILDEINKR